MLPSIDQQQESVNQGRNEQEATSGAGLISPPTISIPQGGGAIRGIGEKFGANPVTGTGTMTVPIATSPGRSGFGPQLSLSYDSGSGNGPFGFGWSLSLPQITRKTDKGLPQYRDAEESDVFLLSSAEDLVPVYRQDFDGSWVAGHPGYQRDPDEFWVRDHEGRLVILEDERDGYRVRRYRPRIEGVFARIERWTNQSDLEDVFWRSISKDNITTWYGKTEQSRIVDPDDTTRIFSWLICQSYDDKGNAIVYEFVEENSERIFEDDQGNPVSLVHERNRNNDTRKANRYLKCIKYGNRIPNRDSNWNPTNPTLLTDNDWMFEVVFDYAEGHYNELPLDFTISPEEQHRYVQANLASENDWPARKDPFSSYRGGFEVRTYRLCRRVLMFHHFPEELSTDDYLVRSTEFTHQESPIASFITSVTQSGYVHKPTPGLQNRYLKKSLPPLEFEYSQPTIYDEVIEVDPESLENLPYGLDGTTYQWVDLDGEGLSGVLTEQGGAWYYKPNLSPAPNPDGNGKDEIKARFGPLQRVTEIPSLANLGSGGQQFLDLAGDGQLDLATFSGPTPGFFERTQEGSWAAFRTFPSLPNLDWNDPNLRFVDLTGDGHADLLITEDAVFNWHLSLAEAGFGPREQVWQALDEEKGPRLVFADGTQSIYQGDFSGDNLVDIGRVRNGEICYWPSLGYGRFGAKVTMDNSPWFDATDQFDQQRIRLADIDGSGTTDIIYLSHDKINIYRNQAGNSWSAPELLENYPKIDNLSAVMAVDLLGNGTACLVWSSPLSGDTAGPMRYIDLMGRRKPHLLIRSVNNLGAETRVQYAPSTKFYRKDKQDGKPWITRIPFPVHVVERVETYDRISRNRFVTRYAYHHGYFDGIEREFRGFGMVEQRDTEEFATLEEDGLLEDADNLEETSHVPPVHTKTWFHTGAFTKGGNISRQFENEYYREGDPSLGEAGLTAEQLQAMLLEDTVLPENLSAVEAREAARALKGSILRQETYGLDDTEEEDRPYLVSERNYTIKQLQPGGGNRHAVYFVHPRETIDFHYERKLYDIGGRKLADPRVTHSMTLKVDDYGNVLQSVAIGYGRRHDDPEPLLTVEDRGKQKQTLITITENRYTNAIKEADSYRTPLTCETHTYELVEAHPSSNLLEVTNLFRIDEMQDCIQKAGDGLHDLPYEDYAAGGATENHPYRRLIEHVRTLYRSNDLASALPLGQSHSLALPFESYQLAFTPGLIPSVYGGRITDSMLENEGRYVHTEGDANWWIPSGKVFYSPNGADSPVQELTFAYQHFFLPHRFRDLFNNETVVTYDSDPSQPNRNHNLLVVETHDAINNVVTVNTRDDQGQAAIRLDYRVLQPYWVTDPNGNRSAVAFDALGMVVGTAVMGKPGENLGDTLEGFKADLTSAVIQNHLDYPFGNVAPPPDVSPHDILQQATSRLVYDLVAYTRTKGDAQPSPAVASTLAREKHESDLDIAVAEKTRIQHSFSYSDGFGREIQKKIQAEPGPLVKGGPETDPRWVGSGWTIFNNKGKPVRQYEPFFDDTHRFKFGHQVGVSPILFYDPVERVIATLHPNHTYEKVVFDPWGQKTYDVNDTITLDPQSDEDVKGFFLNPDGTPRIPLSEYLPTWHDLRTDLLHASEFAARYPDVTDRSNETDAAAKAAAHVDTPSTAYFDTLGRTFLTVAHNKVVCPGHVLDGTEDKFRTRVELDIEGNQRTVIDARNRIVMRYDYSIAGPERDENGELVNTNRIHQASMEAGERWTLNDVTGQPIYAWDSRDHLVETQYDELRRLTTTFVQGIAGYPPGHKVLVEQIMYGESQGDTRNHRGQVHQQYDAAGIVTNIGYDFKGNLAESSRQLTGEYKVPVDWSAPPELAETFTSATRYDALNRPIQMIAPHSNRPGTKVNIMQPVYNEANLLEQMHAWLNQNNLASGLLDPNSANLHAVANIDYNEKGQRTLIEYGNGVKIEYRYDEETFRLTHLLTQRDPSTFPTDCPTPSSPGWLGCNVQNLHYTFDPAGNITHIRDAAQQTIYFRNKRVEPSANYTYDAIYRLVQASGREHLGQTGGNLNPPTPPDAFNSFHTNLDHPGDGNAMGRYIEQYIYDAVGNITRLEHRGSDPAQPGWTRTYAYDEISQLESGKQNNRLSSTQVGDGITSAPEPYSYDAHGNMTGMPHLPLMQWDYRDQLQATTQQVVNNGGTPETTYYVYDTAGQRVRKVTERSVNTQQAANGGQPTRKKERMYLGGFEVYREYDVDGSSVTLERETLHIMDDNQRVALVETKSVDGSLLARARSLISASKALIRYQLGNHLGSASLELDEQARIISYEEYTPYGSTSYHAVDKALNAAAKRYRYTGKERDEENGLFYHGARYYTSWLGRWISCDPLGIRDALNLYQYVRGDPATYIDLAGTNTTQPSIWEVKAGLKISAGSTQLEFRPFVQGSVSLAVTEWGGVDAGAQLQLYTSYPKYGVNRGAWGGNISAYVGTGLTFSDRPENIRTNSFDVRTFAGSGPTTQNLVLGYGLTQWFGEFVGEDQFISSYKREGIGSPLFSRTGVFYSSANWGNKSLTLRYGNDNLLFGNKLDANETAFGSLQLKIGELSGEVGFFNVTDQIRHVNDNEFDPKYAKFTDPEGVRGVKGEIWDKARQLATYQTKGPGVALHAVYGALSAGAFQLRGGIEGEWAHDVTQGAIHRFFGYHLFPHKSENLAYGELNIDLSSQFQFGK